MFFKKPKRGEQEKKEYLEFVKKYWGHVVNEKIEDTLFSYERFLKTLNKLSESNEESVVLISVGCYSPTNTEQQIPSYIKHLAQDKKVTILLIDGNYSDVNNINLMKDRLGLERKKGEEEIFSPREYPNIDCEIFSCFLNFDKRKPSSDQDTLCQQLSTAITHVLKQNGRVFIANHTQAYSFEDIPVLADLANKIKVNYPETLQLYTQGGKGKVRYYLDKQINYNTDSYGMEFNGTFKIVPKLEDLQQIDQFKPKLQVNPNLSTMS